MGNLYISSCNHRDRERGNHGIKKVSPRGQHGRVATWESIGSTYSLASFAGQGFEEAT